MNNKIINILFTESSSGFGGSANALAALINNLDRSIFNPLAVIKNCGPQIDKINDCEIIKLRDYKEPEKLSNFKYLIYFIKNIIPEVLKIYLIIKKKKVHLLHINTNINLGIPAILAAKIAGVPCICHIRETRKLIKREILFAKFVDRFIVLNKDACKIYKQDIQEDKITIVYDGIDLSILTNKPESDFRNEYNLDSLPVIGLIGRVVRGKGQREFIESAKLVLEKIPNARFLVVGDAKGDAIDYLNEVKDYAKRNIEEGSAIFTGWRNDVQNIIESLDILVQASTTFPEGSGLTIIEAMALQKPVIASNIPGPSDMVIDGKTGFLVPPGDVKSLADKIIYLLNHPDVAARMGQAGRKRAEGFFDIKKKAKQIVEIYKVVLSVRK